MDFPQPEHVFYITYFFIILFFMYFPSIDSQLTWIPDTVVQSLFKGTIAYKVKEPIIYWYFLFTSQINCRFLSWCIRRVESESVCHPAAEYEQRMRIDNFLIDC